MFSFDEPQKRKAADERHLERHSAYKWARSKIEFFFANDDERRLATAPQVVFSLNAAALAPLSRISHQRCAFCEDAAQVLDVYRFRPPNDAINLDSTHESDLYSYYWIALSWRNLFPICRDCAPVTPNFFPVFTPSGLDPDISPRLPVPDAFRAGTEDERTAALDPPIEDERERPYLIYPGELRHPLDLFDLRIEDERALLAPRDGVDDIDALRITTTLDQFVLNRDPLAEARFRAIADFQAEMEAGKITSDLHARPFGGVLGLVSAAFLRDQLPDTFERLATAATDNVDFFKSVQRELQRWLSTDASRSYDFSAILDGFRKRVHRPQPDGEDAEASRAEPPRAAVTTGRLREVDTSHSDYDVNSVREGRLILLRKLSISNFRPIMRLCDEDGGPLPLAPDIGAGALPFRLYDPQYPDQGMRSPALMFLGENGSGKTSILQAIALSLLDTREAQALLREVDDQMIIDRNYLLCDVAPPEDSGIRAEITLDFVGEPDGSGRQSGQRHFVTSTKISRIGATYADGGQIETATWAVRMALDSTSDGARECAPTQLPPVVGYGPNRIFGRADDTAEDHGLFRKIAWDDRVLSLFDRTAAIRSPEQALLELAGSKKDGARNAYLKLCQILTNILEFNGRIHRFEVISCDDGGKRICAVVSPPHSARAPSPGSGDGETASAFRIPLEIMSSGFQSIVGIVCDLFLTLYSNSQIGVIRDNDQGKDWTAQTKPAVVLIDEIEAHLHPRWKISVISKLREEFPNVFFIFSTHDPLCLRGMRDGEVYMVDRVVDWNQETPRDEVVVERFRGSLERLTIDQLLTSDLFDLYSTDDPASNSQIAAMMRGGDPPQIGSGSDSPEAELRRLYTEDLVQAMPYLNRQTVQEMVDAIMKNSEVSRDKRQTAFEELARKLDGQMPIRPVHFDATR